MFPTQVLFALLATFWQATAVYGPDDKTTGKHGTFPDECVVVGKEKRSFRLVVPKSVDLNSSPPERH
jgi:hypothetical protein